MFKSSTLLERLAQAGQPAAPSAVSDRGVLKQSIMRNLQNILNTRLGHAQAQPDLGTPPPNELIQDYPACIDRMHETIRECIAKYEPRLSGIQVQYVHDDNDVLSLHFQVVAQVADGSSRAPFSFKTLVDKHGQVGIS
jgi:type VI secretion system protein